MKARKKASLYGRIREILEAARTGVARTVNTTQVVANWLIGREIVEEEQKGRRRAGYGEALVHDLSRRLTVDYGPGFSADNLFWFRRFFLGYPALLGAGKFDAVRQISGTAPIVDAARQISSPLLSVGKPPIHYATSGPSNPVLIFPAISDAMRRKSWQPGQLHPNLSWTHYRTLLRVEKPAARAFYEIEAIKNNWSARELERQVNSLLYERLALSKDKRSLLRLATKGHEVSTPADVFKEPVVIEFLGLPESPRLVESKLEEALITNLQAFLMELGKGFAFVARQKRITLDGDHFYIDLVFYHTILKCYVLLDLKVKKLTHEDLGQLQLCVNYYDQEQLTPGDNPTLGLILCTDQNDTMIKYTLGPNQQRSIFARRYKLHLPTEAELQAEMRRGLRLLRRTS